MLWILSLAAVITTAGFGGTAQASPNGLMRPVVTTVMMPAPNGAKVLTVNTYLTNPNNVTPGRFMFAVVPGTRNKHGLDLSVKLVGFKAKIYKEESADKTGYFYIIAGANLAPHQRIYFSTTYRASDIKAGMCVAGSASFLGPPVLQQSALDHNAECWNLTK